MINFHKSYVFTAFCLCCFLGVAVPSARPESAPAIGSVRKLTAFKAKSQPGKLVIFTGKVLGYVLGSSMTATWNTLRYEQPTATTVVRHWEGLGSYQKQQFWSLSPDGSALLAPISSGVIGLWSASAFIRSLPAAKLDLAVFISQNHVVALSSYHTPITYNLVNRTIEQNHLRPGSFYEAATSSLNQQLFAVWAATEGDSVIKLTDLQTGKSQEVEQGRENDSRNSHNSVPEPIFLSSKSKIVFVNTAAYAYADDLKIARPPLKVFDPDKERVLFMDKAERFLTLDFEHKRFTLRTGKDFHVVWHSTPIEVEKPNWDTPETATVTAVSVDGHDVAVAQDGLIRVWRLNYK